MPQITYIYNLVLLIISILTGYRFFFIAVGFLFRPKEFKETEIFRHYAIVIAARNEENVIESLIKSIQSQNYPNNLLSIFIVADNCTDNTALISRNNNAIVYERFNKEHISKGYALQYLFNKISIDYPKNFDGFIIFDADNILEKNCIRELNKAFNGDNSIVTGFRSIKNFSNSFISASYGIHFFRNTLTLHRPRQVLNLSTHITGTGFLFSSQIVENGWNYTELTEDYEFTVKNIALNKKIVYCEKAIFYDEQPTDIKTMLRQRLRWTKGHILNFFFNTKFLFKSLFKKPCFSKYDILITMIPIGLVSFLLGLAFQIITICYHADFSIIIKFYLNYLLVSYLFGLLIGLLTIISFRKEIKCFPIKLIFYWLIWPFFDIISIPLTIIVLFKKVKWQPIIHKGIKTDL